jgi:hypothetical protein
MFLNNIFSYYQHVDMSMDEMLDTFFVNVYLIGSHHHDRWLIIRREISNNNNNNNNNNNKINIMQYFKFLRTMIIFRPSAYKKN